MTAPVLVTTGLRQTADATSLIAVDDMTFGPGATAVLGPNGSGKSTLLRMLATVTRPSAGTIVVDGLDVAGPVERTAVRRRLGYVSQANGLPSRMRVGAYLDYVGALKEIGPERLRRRWTAWALERVELSANRHDRVGTLSGGMQRRLAIGQALLGGPDLYVLDEPLASLDAEHRTRITRLIAELSASSTVIVATHHADELAAICHRVLVLDTARLVFDGTPAQLAARAEGRTWDAATVDETASCRAIGPDRYRCVGAALPHGVTPVEPSVGDGYVAVVRYGA